MEKFFIGFCAGGIFELILIAIILLVQRGD